MGQRVIWARIVEHTAGQFLVVVSSGHGAPSLDTDPSSDLMTSEAPNHQEAVALRERLISIVSGRIADRGDVIATVERLG